MAVGDLGLAGLHRLGADLSRQVLGRDLAVAVHQHHQRPRILVLHDQCLHHGVRVPAQHLRAVLRPAVLQVLVGMLGVVHLVRLEQLGGRGFRDVFFLGHA